MPKPTTQEVVTLKIPGDLPASLRSFAGLNRAFEAHYGYGFRFLKDDEVIERGDQYVTDYLVVMSHQWINFGSPSVGQRVPYGTGTARRKLDVGAGYELVPEDGTIEEGDEFYSNGFGDWMINSSGIGMTPKAEKAVKWPDNHIITYRRPVKKKQRPEEIVYGSQYGHAFDTVPHDFEVVTDGGDTIRQGDALETETFQVNTVLGGGIRVRPSLEKETPKLSQTRQRNGISPNFVHSLDAAALCKTISYCLKHGIKSYCMIHDSYGTHAPYVHQMAASLRHAFVDIFSKDQLTNLRDQWVKQLEGVEGAEVLPTVPEMGELDIQSLHDSEFFFA